MGLDPRWLTRMDPTAVSQRRVRTAVLGPTPTIPVDLQLVLAAVEQAGYGPATLEYRFDVQRKWAFDAAWPEQRIAFEREGGRFVNETCDCGRTITRFVSRHHSKDGLEADAVKYNAAAVAGWCVIRATPGMLADGRALAAVLAAHAARFTPPSA